MSVQEISEEVTALLKSKDVTVALTATAPGAAADVAADIAADVEGDAVDRAVAPVEEAARSEDQVYVAAIFSVNDVPDDTVFKTELVASGGSGEGKTPLFHVKVSLSLVIYLCCTWSRLQALVLTSVYCLSSHSTPMCAPFYRLRSITSKPCFAARR
jgi:hypothetical protein